jgi:hypothetical protein
MALKYPLFLLAGLLVTMAITTGMSETAGGPPAPIQWSAHKKLSWSDFQGQPDRYSDMQAMTHSGIDFSYDCYRGEFRVNIQASFDPSKSWRKRSASDRILAHEQLHFDITELCARRMRKAFSEQPDPCRLGNAQIMKIANQHFDYWKKLQQQYDIETRHSILREKQAEWEGKVAAELTVLSAWAE